jgi:serine/threonine protein kinase
MGSVWLARHTANDAPYALKVIPAASEAEVVERFRREGEAMARVQAHPHLTRVHALLEAEGWLALAIEYCPGGDLAGRLRLGPLEPQIARDLVAALADGLHVAHGAGILHRDLKPANVIFDEDDRPKLTDFGLAKLHDRQSLTQSGALLGTPAYMAPEQATTGTCDARTDVYGLGGVLYHCLSGAPPFSGASVLAILDQVLTEPPPPLPPHVPPHLASACLRALAKDPDDRFPDAASFGAALTREVAAPGPSRGLLAGAALFGLVVAGGALLHAALRPPTPTPTPTPRPSSTPSPSPAVTPSAPPAFPGLFPWPERAPQEPRPRGSLRLLQSLAARDSLACPVVYARHLRWRIPTRRRLENLSRRFGPFMRPSLHLRAYEGGLPTLAGLAPHFRGALEGDGFEGDPVLLELFLLGLLRNGDPEVHSELERCYQGAGLGALREQLANSTTDPRAWRALGLRARGLAAKAARGQRPVMPLLPRGKAERLLLTAWAELAPQSAYTFQLGLSLPPAGFEAREDLELRGAAMATLNGNDAGLLVSATTLGSLTAARGLARHLLKRSSAREQQVGRALYALVYMASDELTRKTMALQGELSLAGFLVAGKTLSAQLDGAHQRMIAALRAAGLLETPPASPGLAPLPEAPPQKRAGLEVRALLEEFLPEAPLLQCLWRETLLTKASQGGSPQAIQLRDALGAKGLSALKNLTESLGKPESYYYDPVLATRLALRLVRGGQSGTSMILFRQVEQNEWGSKVELLSACLGLSAAFDDASQAHTVARTGKFRLEVPSLAEAWPPLRALDEALATRPFRLASERSGPPPQIDVEGFVQATASVYSNMRWLQRISLKIYTNTAKGERLYERIMDPEQEIPRTRGLMAAFRRGVHRALPPLLDEHPRIRNSTLLSVALCHFLISAEEGPLAKRESWDLAIKGLNQARYGDIARLLESLRREPEREDLWRSFYLARERILVRLGLPGQPEFAAWGTPREVLGEGD